MFIFDPSNFALFCMYFFRYGNEEKLVTVFGVMQALVSFITHGDEPDLLRSISAGDRKFVFLVKEHVILVAVSR